MAECPKKKKKDPSTSHLQGIRFRAKDTQRLKVKGGKKTIHAKGNMKVGVNSHKRQNRLQGKDKEGHYTMIESSIYEEDIILLIYMHSMLGVPNIGAPKYIK